MCSANIGRLLLSVAFTAHAAFSALAPIEDIHDLYRAIEAGPNRKVGFLSKGNFETVKEVLPSSVVPVYVEDTAHLEEQVTNGTIVAALISGVPHHEFHHFTSTLVSPRAMLLQKPADDLLEAIDAAVVRMRDSVTQLARQNPPFRVVAVHSCRPDAAAFPFPRPTPNSRLAQAIERGTLRIAALGPYDWKQDGDYTVDPPRGFWPDYFQLVCSELELQYNVSCIRQWHKSSQGVMDAVSAGLADVTEPYWTLDSMYNGRGRKHAFAASCVTMGYDSTFFVLRSVAPFDDRLKSTLPCAPLSDSAVSNTRPLNKDTPTSGSSNVALSVAVALFASLMLLDRQLASADWKKSQ